MRSALLRLRRAMAAASVCSISVGSLLLELMDVAAFAHCAHSADINPFSKDVPIVVVFFALIGESDPFHSPFGSIESNPML
jgi:hypothetical protein